MGRKEKDRIDTESGSGALSFNPFAALEAEKFPERDNSKAEAPAKLETNKPSKKGRVVLRRETADRGGKTVVVVSDFASEISQNEIEEIAKKLRKFCGCGGAVKGREIEIQGEQVSRVREFLSEMGFRVDGIH